MAGEWVAEKGRKYLMQVFGNGFEEVQKGIFQGACPGAEHHSKKSAKTDCRIHVGYGANGEKPGAYCLHHSCKHVLDRLNTEFRDLIFAKDEKYEVSGKSKGDAVAKEPVSKEPWVPDYDENRLREYVRSAPAVTKEFFMERSPVEVKGITSGVFLDAMFDSGQRVLIFTDFYSQGQYGWLVGRDGARLGARGVMPVKSVLPTNGGRDGVWYLCQPVDGKFHMNPRTGKMSRRSEESVIEWRHLVLESDDAPEDLWFKFLALLDVPIKAIYSSGGKSWHALVAVGKKGISKAEFDLVLREKVKRVLPIFGADPAAMTPVRLTRLPGCTRQGRLQELVYLNPEPDSRIVDMLPLRSL